MKCGKCGAPVPEGHDYSHAMAFVGQHADGSPVYIGFDTPDAHPLCGICALECLTFARDTLFERLSSENPEPLSE